MSRWIVEGEWSGYTSSQRHVVHRKVLSGRESFKNAIKDLGYIQYTDGTRLDLMVRDCNPRERVSEINGYGSLIEDCVRHGTRRVADLPKK